MRRSILAGFLFVVLCSVASFALLRVGVGCPGDKICSATAATPWNFAWVNVTGNYELKASITCKQATDENAALHVIYQTPAGPVDLLAATAVCDGGNMNG